MGGLSGMFVNPAMLLGGLAIAAPILIFLLTRYRYKTVDWAALVFLQRAFKKQQRRLRLENLILLLIRCLILILFALVLARPRSVSEVVVNNEEKTRNVVLMIDVSYSMGYQVGSTEEESVYERARRAAKEIVAGLEEFDRLNIVAFDEQATALYAKPVQLTTARKRREVLQDLLDVQELQLSQRGTDLAEALHKLPEVLRQFDFAPDGTPPIEGAPPVPKTIYLLTDAQRYGFLDGEGRLIDKGLATKAREIKKLGGTIALVDCGLDDPKNVSITHLGAREPVVGRELPCHIETVVKNWSIQKVNDLTVEYWVDGKGPQKTVSLRLPPGEEATPDPLRYVFHKAGLHHVEVRVRSDALTIDNRRTFVVDVREHVRVLLVDGEPFRERWRSETDFLKVVLSLSRYAKAGRGLMRPEVINEAQLSGKKLEEFEAVVVANVESLSDESTAALEQYARTGGAVVFTLGGLVQPQRYNEVLWREGRGLFPVKLAKKTGGTREEASTDEDAPEWVMDLGDHRDHAVAMFKRKDMQAHLRLPSVFGFFSVDLEAGAEGTKKPWVPLRLISKPSDDNLGGKPEPDGPSHPLLVEKTFGRGRVVAWLSTADYNWNNCVLYDGFYLPFWRTLILDLAQRTRPAVNLSIGGRYERLVPAEEYTASIEVESPGEGQVQGVALKRVEGQDLYKLIYPRVDKREGLQEAGLYTVRRGNAKKGKTAAAEYFSVRLTPEEGDLTKFTPEELKEALDVPVKPIFPEGARDSLQAQGVHGGAREFWREVLAAVIVLLVLESILAAVFGRKRT